MKYRTALIFGLIIVLVGSFLFWTSSKSLAGTVCLTVPAGQTAWFPGENSAADVAGGNPAGALAGDAFYTNNGRVGRAFTFDGNGDYVVIPDHPSQKPVNQLTVEGWFRFSSFSGGLPHLVSKPLKGSFFNSYALWYESGEMRIGYQPSGGGFVNLGTGFAPTPGVWYHFAMALDTDTDVFKFYADGVEAFSGAASDPISYDAAPHPLLIGSEFEADVAQYFFDGQADEVSLYSRALTPAEIQSIFSAGNSGKCAPPRCAEVPHNLISGYAGELSALDSRSHNHGILNGPVFAKGKVGQSFSFDGVDDNVTVPHAPSLNITGDQLTIEAWINLDATATGNKQIAAMADGLSIPLGRKFGLYVDAGNRLGFEVRTAGGYVDQSVGAVPTNVFVHVAGVYNGSSMVWYIDGVNVGSVAQAGNITASMGNLVIGEFAVPGNSPFKGSIDEVGIYDRALSAAEIQAIFAAGQSGKCKPLSLNRPAGLNAWFTADSETVDFANLNPAGALQGGAGYAIGKVGQAFHFDGIDDYVAVPHDADQQPTTGALSIEGWFRFNALNNQAAPHLISKPLRNSVFNSYAIYLEGSVLKAGHGTNALFDVIDSGFSPRLGQWYYIAYVIDDANDLHTLYVNGVPVVAPLTTNLPLYFDGIDNALTPHPLLIGGEIENNAAQWQLSGRADEVSLYSRALTPAELQAIYNAGLAGKVKTAATPTGFAALRRGSSAASGVPAGVVVDLSSATVTFPSVTAGGTTSQAGADPALLPALPSWAIFTGIAQNISTTAGYTSPVTVCLDVAALPSSGFSEKHILHLEGSTWVNRTTARSYPQICAQVPSLSPFVVVQGLAPTAASVSVAGRVVMPDGRGVRGVTVKLTDPAGNGFRARTNSFGHYRFADVAAGETYVLTAASNRYAFSPGARVVNVTENVTGVDFTAFEATVEQQAEAGTLEKIRR